VGAYPKRLATAACAADYENMTTVCVCGTGTGTGGGWGLCASIVVELCSLPRPLYPSWGVQVRRLSDNATLDIPVLQAGGLANTTAQVQEQLILSLPLLRLLGLF
jgi:hypothetical protein